jgi:hypothetical protein
MHLLFCITSVRYRERGCHYLAVCAAAVTCPPAQPPPTARDAQFFFFGRREAATRFLIFQPAHRFSLSNIKFKSRF